jgi:L-amino acid N-acyltransferase YncA
MIVRGATSADMRDILRMARAFYATTEYTTSAPMCDETVEGLANWMIESGVMLVAETEDGAVVGMVGLAVAPFMFNRAITSAHEVVWYVDTAARNSGAGRALLAAIEPACAARGISRVQMVHLTNSPAEAAALYERMGFHLSESCYTKELTPWQQ